MIVPDKITEIYLNEPADVSGLEDLCREGILPPNSFLRAVALCRSADKWRILCRKVLTGLTCISFVLALLFLIISEWSFFYTFAGGLFLLSAFVFCFFLRRWAFAEYAGILLTGFLIFLPDMIFGTDFFLYEQFFLWFVLSVLWAIPSERTMVRLWPFVALNVALFLYGVQFVLPIFGMSPELFCVWAAVLNLLVLAIREAVFRQTGIFDSFLFRLMPLLFAGLYLIAGIAVQTFYGNGGISFLYGFIYVLFLGCMLFWKKVGGGICFLFYGFVFCWGSLLLYSVFKNAGLSVQNMQTFLACAESLLIVLLIILRNKTVLQTEEKADVD